MSTGTRIRLLPAETGTVISLPEPSPGRSEGTPRITLRQLNYFVHAADQESVLRAAAALNVSPPAISGAISGLEQYLAGRLFIRRHARGLVLTDLGRRLLIEARALLAQARELEALRQDEPVRAPRRLSFGCLGDIAPYIVPPIVHNFLLDSPDVEVTWYTGEHGVLMEKLAEGSIDFAVFLDFEQSPAVHTTVLRPTPPQCVLPPDHPLAALEAVPLAALTEYPFILLDIPRTRDYFLSIFAAHGLQPMITHRTHSAEMVRGMVANCFGCSLLNFWPPGNGLGPVYRPLVETGHPTNLVAARLHRGRASRTVERFLNCAREVVATIPFAADVAPAG